jgi:hypothetical protein
MHVEEPSIKQTRKIEKLVVLSLSLLFCTFLRDKSRKKKLRKYLYRYSDAMVRTKEGTTDLLIFYLKKCVIPK